jgi:hypothetical protein
MITTKAHWSRVNQVESALTEDTKSYVKSSASITDEAVHPVSPAVVGIVMSPDVIEDWLDHVRITLEEFLDQMMGSWMFGYMKALKARNVETVVFCVSDRTSTTQRLYHRRTDFHAGFTNIVREQLSWAHIGSSVRLDLSLGISEHRLGLSWTRSVDNPAQSSSYRITKQHALICVCLWGDL